MYRAVVLATLVVLLLAVAGVAIAGSGDEDPTEPTTPEGTSLGSTVAEDPDTTTPGGPSPEPEGIEETTEGISEPTVIIEPTVEETEEPTVLDDTVEETPTPNSSASKEHSRPGGVVGLDAETQGTNGRGVGRPEHAGKPLDSGDSELRRSGGGQQKVSLCHKGKTLTVGEPAVAAHLRHGDSLGACTDSR
jgi:hypothetical protein